MLPHVLPVQSVMDQLRKAPVSVVGLWTYNHAMKVCFLIYIFLLLEYILQSVLRFSQCQKCIRPKQGFQFKCQQELRYKWIFGCPCTARSLSVYEHANNNCLLILFHVNVEIVENAWRKNKRRKRTVPCISCIPQHSAKPMVDESSSIVRMHNHTPPHS
jgi:hypothetical protein